MSANWTCACIEAKFSLDGSNGAEALSAAEVVLSVSGRQLGLTSISKPKHGPARANLQPCLQADYCCCHETQNPDCLFYDLSTFLIARLPRMKKNKRTGLSSIWASSFKSALFLPFVLPMRMFLTLHECNRLKHVIVMSNVSQQQLIDPNRGSCPAALSARPSLLSSPVARSGTRGSQGVSPLPSQDPGPPPDPSSLSPLYCVSMDKTASTTGCAIIGRFVRSNWDASVRLLFYSCLRKAIYLRDGVIEW